MTTKMIIHQMVILKNKSDGMVSVGIPVPFPIAAGRNGVRVHLPAVIAVQTADHIEQRCLSGTARAENRDKLTIPKRQG